MFYTTKKQVDYIKIKKSEPKDEAEKLSALQSLATRDTLSSSVMIKSSTSKDKQIVQNDKVQFENVKAAPFIEAKIIEKDV